MSSKEESLELLKDQICIVSNRVAVEGQAIGLMYREKPDFEEDTGWRLLAGAETQKYLDKDENLEIWTIEELLSQHAEVGTHLHLPLGSELQLDEGGSLKLVEEVS